MRALWLGALLALGIATPASGATLTVDTLDGPVNDGRCSFAEALDNASGDDTSGSPSCPAGSGADTIRFSVAGTIIVDDLLGSQGTLVIEGGGDVAISGDDRTSILTHTGDLTLRGLTVRDGRGDLATGGITSSGTLRVEDSRFLDNVVTEESGSIFLPSGAIKHMGELTVVRSVFRGNRGANDGALSVQPVLGSESPGRLSVTDSVFEGNSSRRFGGGAIGTVETDADIRRSLFTGNRADDDFQGAGAILAIDGTAAIANSTITGNTSDTIAGGIFNRSPLTLRNTTIVGNRVTGDGGASNLATEDAVTASNTIVADPGTKPNCGLFAGQGSFTDGGGNLEGGANSCGFAAGNVDPRLDPRGLRDNGGPTATIALCRAAGVPAGCEGASPALNTGLTATCQSEPVGFVDQRGVDRGQGPGCDAGAYESGRDRFRFLLDALSVPEGAGTVELTVERLESGDGASTAPIDFSGTAGAADLGPIPSVPFAAGEVRRTVTIPITDDDLDEDDETAELTLPGAEEQTTATLTLVDDDGPPALSAEAAAADEGDALTFAVRLDRPSGKTVTVDYTAPGDSALQGTDYDVAAGTLSFAPGDTEETVTVTTVEDPRAEGDETFTLALANAGNATIAAATATGTIRDDDPVVVLTDPAGGLITSEAGTTATFTVALGSEPAADVTVALTSSDATEGTISPATLTFTPANARTPQTVTLTGIDDDEDDGDIAYLASIDPASADPAYDALPTGTVGATNADDDAAPPATTPTPSPSATPTPDPTPEQTATPTPTPTPPQRSCTLRGTPGRDVLRGTPGRDVICARGGDDVVRGLRGNDLVRGGAGNDRLFGGPGNDVLLGGKGNDRLFGGRGSDTLRGNTGTDRLSGGPGADRVQGGPGRDRLRGGPGADRMRSGRRLG